MACAHSEGRVLQDTPSQTLLGIQKHESLHSSSKQRVVFPIDGEPSILAHIFADADTCPVGYLPAQVIKQCLNPDWDEVFQFPVSPNVVLKKEKLSVNSPGDARRRAHEPVQLLRIGHVIVSVDVQPVR